MSDHSIVETLQQQLELYERLLEMAELKTPVLVRNDVEQLNGISLKERKLFQRAEELEQQRIAQTCMYFTKMGFWTRSGKLSDMIRIVTQPQEKMKLMELQQQLLAKIGELQKANELNQQLITHSLRFIEYSIDLVIEDPNEDVTYQHPMNRAYGNSRTGMFDSRA